MTLSDERSFVMWRALGLAFRGWCLAALGQPDQGIPLISAGLVEVRASGTIHVPHVLTLFADAHRMAGQPQVRSHTSPKPSSLPKPRTPNGYRPRRFGLRGDLMHIVGDFAGAEASFLDAITLAQRQGAKLFELRASSISPASGATKPGTRKPASSLLRSIIGLQKATMSVT